MCVVQRKFTLHIAYSMLWWLHATVRGVAHCIDKKKRFPQEIFFCTRKNIPDQFILHAPSASRSRNGSMKSISPTRCAAAILLQSVSGSKFDRSKKGGAYMVGDITRQDEGRPNARGAIWLYFGVMRS